MSADPQDQTGVLSPVSAEGQRSTPVEAVLPDIGPRYLLTSKLGEGGMGFVYRGEDRQTARGIAVKLLSANPNTEEASSQRFQKEARLLAEVQHPHVANLLDFGEYANQYFLVMELVDGLDLRQAIRKHGVFSERLALQVIRDVADALAAAHSQGIIHRDLKPGNILLSVESRPNCPAATAVLEALGQDEPPYARLTDFGLARHVDQSASLELTKSGALLGTPYYIAPEQCSERGHVSPSSDVYSLGATLFEMLTGRPPFLSDDPVKLITAHCFEKAPKLRTLQPELSDAVEALVARMLQKVPSERYTDGGQVREAIDRILLGDLSTTALHPLLPTAKGRVFEANWEWELVSSAEALWPYVSHTDRLNAAVGLPPVDYEFVRDDVLGIRQFGSFRLGFAKLRWEEHPFEWIEGRRVGVLREFDNGPFAWFLNIVELESLPTGGTRLTHRVQIATRGLLGRLLAYIEVDLKGKKPVDRIYRRIDDVLSGRLGTSPTLDHFTPPPKVTTPQRHRINACADQLRTKKVDAETTEALLRFLTESPPQELARLRPLALAQRLGVPAQHLVNVCLQACQVGLLELHWDILCPTCRVAANVTSTLAEIGKHQRCPACDLDFDVDFARSVELFFRIHPDIRAAELKTFCLGGPAEAPHVVSQTRINPAETVQLDLQLDAGTYILRGPQLPFTIRLQAVSQQGTSFQSLSLRPGQIVARTLACRAGRHVLSLTNEFSHPVVVRIERTIPRQDCLTAADALRIPAFRQLFPEELLSRDRLSSVSTHTLLALRITNILELFAQLGDLGTSDHLLNSLAQSRSAIEASGGMVLQESEDQLLAAFRLSGDAARAAVKILDEERVSAGPVPRSCISLSRGTMMATTFNGQIDLQGRTLAQAAQSLSDAGANRLLISPELSTDHEFRSILHDAGWQASDEGHRVDNLQHQTWTRLLRPVVPPGKPLTPSNPQINSGSSSIRFLHDSTGGSAEDVNDSPLVSGG